MALMVGQMLFDEWHNPAWYGGRTENPQAIWDGVA